VLLAMRKQTGFSTMMALGLAGLVGLMAVVSLSLREQQMKTLKFTERKAAASNLARQITDLFQDISLCGCQLSAPGITFDANQTDGSQAITLAELRTACGPAAPILVQNGTQVPGNMTVSRIELAGLTPSAPGATLWNAVWRIHWNTGSDMPIKPAEIQQRVQLDPAVYAATPGAARIQACLPVLVGGSGVTGGGGGGGPIQSCATGYVMIGPAGGVGTFCIEQNEHGQATYKNALLGCASPSPTSQGNPKLCNHTKWYLGCRSGLLNNATDNNEWNIEFAGTVTVAVASGSGSCETSAKVGVNNSTNYRCCYP